MERTEDAKTSYTIIFHPAARREITSLSEQLQLRIFNAIEKLELNPRPSGVKKLRDTENYRIRIGDYRVLYMIEDQILRVNIIAVAHRRDVYR